VKKTQPEESVKSDIVVLQLQRNITILLQASEETNNSVYMLITDKLQSVLIDVLIRSITER